jgi:hypothetical protein
MGIYLKVYNFGPDEATHKPVGQITYEVVKTGSNDKILDYTEDVSQLPDASASQITIQKFLPLKNYKLSPGSYTLRLKITDKNRNQVLPLATQFTVT